MDQVRNRLHIPYTYLVKDFESKLNEHFSFGLCLINKSFLLRLNQFIVELQQDLYNFSLMYIYTLNIWSYGYSKVIRNLV